MAVLSRKLQQLDEEREKCSDKIKNTEIRLEQVSQGVDESERLEHKAIPLSDQTEECVPTRCLETGSGRCWITGR